MKDLTFRDKVAVTLSLRTNVKNTVVNSYSTITKYFLFFSYSYPYFGIFIFVLVYLDWHKVEVNFYSLYHMRIWVPLVFIFVITYIFVTTYYFILLYLYCITSIYYVTYITLLITLYLLSLRIKDPKRKHHHT